MPEDQPSQPSTPNPPAGAAMFGSKSGQVASGAESVVITSHFKMIWLTVTSLTLSLAVADVMLAIIFKNPSGSEQQAMTMCDTFAGMGFGGIFGLLSGKALG